jgi:hypothetical protein
LIILYLPVRCIIHPANIDPNDIETKNNCVKKLESLRRISNLKYQNLASSVILETRAAQ